MGKRIVFFLLTNILVLTTIAIIVSILGINPYAGGRLDLVPLLIFSAIIGFSGAFISLALSRWMAKKMMNIRVLDPNESLSLREREIVDQVHRLSRKAGLMHMPEVGIYDSPEVNAFATGPTKKRSLVAVSTGLLQAMDDDAVEGVLAHEVAHIANGDMVTMTLLQGVVNTFVVFFARIVAYIVANVVSRYLNNNSIYWIVHFVCIIFFQIVFSILGSLVVMAFSRYREYRADEGGADFAGKDKMVHALRSLQSYVNRVDDQQTSLSTLKINNKRGVMGLMSSHPDLGDRIRHLESRK